MVLNLCLIMKAPIHENILFLNTAMVQHLNMLLINLLSECFSKHPFTNT